jgi:hypothetical protein
MRFLANNNAYYLAFIKCTYTKSVEFQLEKDDYNSLIAQKAKKATASSSNLKVALRWLL